MDEIDKDKKSGKTKRYKNKKELKRSSRNDRYSDK